METLTTNGWSVQWPYHWVEGSEGTDVLNGYLGVDVVVGAHGDLDDYIRGMSFLIIPAVKSGQGAAHHLDLLVDLQALGGDEDRVLGLAQDILQLLHLVLGDEGVGPDLRGAVHHEPVDGGIAQEDSHELGLLGPDEYLSGNDHRLLLVTVAAFVDLLLCAAGHIDVVVGLREHGPDGAFLGGLALRDVPFLLPAVYGKARAFMQVCRAHLGIVGCFYILCHFRKCGPLSG